VRIATDRSTNVAHHERIHEAVARAVEQTLGDAPPAAN
jgi:hypothetical protein